MHKLDRATATPPVCLGTYNYKTQTWDDLDSGCKRALRAALVQMQGIPGVTTANANEFGLRCAYCEGTIHNAGHIEHFRRKNKQHFPQLTFAWDNLFLACGSYTHCGHFKDRNGAPAYNPSSLIKPDMHDPDHYLFFHSSGEVRSRAGLSQSDEHCAKETIRVFGLDCSGLCGRRRSAVSTYKKKILEELEIISGWTDAERNEYLTEEIEATQWEPYATTIKHFLQKQR